MRQKRVEPAWDWIKKLGFAPAIRTGDTIHTCGMIAYGPDGKLVGEGDCYAQSMQVYQNIRDVLALEGARMADIVKTTTYLPDMSVYKEYARARAETFPGAIPSSTTVGTALVLPELMIEIEAVAVIGSGGVGPS